MTNPLISKMPGFLSDEDIKRYIAEDEICIFPYDENNLTQVGYNLTATEFIFSINQGLLVDIENENNQKFCYINPNDTVLILTREAIYVSNKIAGTFHSKVKIVSQGFGHISTTLDPKWQGPLLISLNNPTQKKIKFTISKFNHDLERTENKDNNLKIKHCSFVTLILYRIVSPSIKMHDNPSCRFELLEDIMDNYKLSLWDKLWNKIFFINKNRMILKELICKISKVNFKDLSETDGIDKIDIEAFKKKYRNFMEMINHTTNSAHSANKRILNREFGKKLFLVAIPLLVLVSLSVYAYFLLFGTPTPEDSVGNKILVLTMFCILVGPWLSECIKWVTKK